MSRITALFTAIVMTMGLSLVVAQPASAAGTCSSLYTVNIAVRNNANNIVYYVNLPTTGHPGTTSCSYWNADPIYWSAGAVELQRALRYCYGANIAADGYFGRATEQALIAAQKKEGITADGIYGPTTRSNIKWRKAKASGAYASGCGRTWVNY